SQQDMAARLQVRDVRFETPIHRVHAKLRLELRERRFELREVFFGNAIQDIRIESPCRRPLQHRSAHAHDDEFDAVSHQDGKELIRDRRSRVQDVYSTLSGTSPPARRNAERPSAIKRLHSSSALSRSSGVRPSAQWMSDTSTPSSS